MYVDGFVLPVPIENLKEYKRISRAAGKIWRELGALEYRECVGDDLQIPGVLPFSKAVKLKEGETAVFAWIIYKSKKDRDRINAAIMDDPRMQKIMGADAVPFDCKRMYFGGFKLMVDM